MHVLDFPQTISFHFRKVWKSPLGEFPLETKTIEIIAFDLVDSSYQIKILCLMRYFTVLTSLVFHVMSTI